jgi:hypothetical protein
MRKFGVSVIPAQAGMTVCPEMDVTLSAWADFDIETGTLGSAFARDLPSDGSPSRLSNHV